MKKSIISILILIIFNLSGMYVYLKLNNLSYTSRVEVNDMFIPMAVVFLIVTGSVAIVGFGILPNIGDIVVLKKKSNQAESHIDKIVTKQVHENAVQELNNKVELLKLKIEEISKSPLSEQEKVNKILWAFCKHYSISQAILYTWSKDHNKMALKATYAINSDSHTQQFVEWGVGLTGEVYAERLPFLIKNVPPDYFKITSGLGQAVPATLFIYPCLIEDKVIAIFELSTFEKWDKSTIEKIENSCQFIISCINCISDAS